VNWFADCPPGKSSSSKLATACSVACAAQSLDPNITPSDKLACGSIKTGIGPCGKQPIFGFTDSTNCKNGFRYEYCPVATRCTDTCQSACENTRQVCTFQKRGDGGIYKCVGPSGPNGPTSPTGPTGAPCFVDFDCPSDQVCINNVCVIGARSKQNDILIIAGIIVGIIILGIIIYTIYAFKRSKKS